MTHPSEHNAPARVALPSDPRCMGMAVLWCHTLSLSHAYKLPLMVVEQMCCRRSSTVDALLFDLACQKQQKATGGIFCYWCPCHSNVVRWPVQLCKHVCTSLINQTSSVGLNKLLINCFELNLIINGYLLNLLTNT